MEQKERKYVIYVHQNKINGKMYIGQTSQVPVTKRWGTQGQGYQTQFFFRAIKKYGWDNFNHIILFENLTLEMADIIEQALIIKYKTYLPEFGYNGDLGGKGSVGHKVSEESRKKMRANLGKVGFDSIKGKPVRCLENNEIFGSARQAELKHGISLDKIAACCRGDRHSAAGLHWMWEDEYTPEKAQEILNYEPKDSSIKVRCKENNMVFKNLKEAAAWAGLKSTGNLCSCCKGKRQHAGKIPGTKIQCSWEYVDDDDEAVG